MDSMFRFFWVFFAIVFVIAIASAVFQYSDCRANGVPAYKCMAIMNARNGINVIDMDK